MAEEQSIINNAETRNKMHDDVINLINHLDIELKEFYAPYFPDSDSLDVFINRVFKSDWDDRKPRRMLFQVQRFVTLATDINKIRPARDGLRVLFLKCCMESLAKLSNLEPKSFYDVFASSFSSKGKEYLLESFSLAYIDHSENEISICSRQKLIIDDILLIIKAMRDLVVHDGNYWEMQLFAYDDDSTWLTTIETNDQLLSKKTYKNETKQLVTYHFQTTMQYENFRYHFVQACINFINNYIDNKTSESRS